MKQNKDEFNLLIEKKKTSKSKTPKLYELFKALVGYRIVLVTHHRNQLLMDEKNKEICVMMKPEESSQLFTALKTLQRPACFLVVCAEMLVGTLLCKVGETVRRQKSCEWYVPP